MFPQNYRYQADVKQQDFAREVKRLRLIQQARTGTRQPGTRSVPLLARFGGWLIVRGSRLEARHRLPDVPLMPAKSAINIRS